MGILGEAGCVMVSVSSIASSIIGGCRTGARCAESEKTENKQRIRINIHILKFIFPPSPLILIFPLYFDRIDEFSPRSVQCTKGSRVKVFQSLEYGAVFIEHDWVPWMQKT